VNIEGEVTKMPIFIAKTYQVAVTPSPPNSGRENERLGTQRTHLQPMTHLHIYEEVLIVESNMVPNRSRGSCSHRCNEGKSRLQYHNGSKDRMMPQREQRNL